MRTHKILHVKENREDILIMLPHMALCLTLTSSNYPCLEHSFMVPKVFGPLKFYCSNTLQLAYFSQIFPTQHMTVYIVC